MIPRLNGRVPVGVDLPFAVTDDVPDIYRHAGAVYTARLPKVSDVLPGTVSALIKIVSCPLTILAARFSCYIVSFVSRHCGGRHANVRRYLIFCCLAPALIF